MITMSAVWDRTTEFLSDNLAAVTGIAGLTFGAAAAQNILQPVMVTVGPGASLGLSLLVLALSLLGLWGQTALIALALDPLLDRGGALRAGLARLPAVIGVGLLVLLAVLVLAVPVIAILVAYGVDPSTLSETGSPSIAPAAALWIALYAVVLVPMLAWVSARLAPLSAVVVGERRGAGAITRTFALTRGLALRILGVTILFAIVAGVATLAAKTVFGSIVRLAFGDEGPLSAANVTTALVVALISTLCSVIACAFVAKLYLALRDRAAVTTV